MPRAKPTNLWSRCYPWVAVALAAVFYCYEYFLRIAPGVMDTELRQAFHIGAFEFGNMAAFYYYAYTPLQIPVGLIFDRFSSRWTLSLACLLCALGALIFGYTDELMVAKLGRFLMGFGSAFAFVGVLSLANQWLSPRIFAFIAGLTTTLGMLGAIEGELWLAHITENFGWQATMQYAGYAGVIITSIIFLIIRDNPDVIEKRRAEPAQIEFLPILKEVLATKSIWLAGIIGSLFYLSLSVFAELWAVPFLREGYNLAKIEAAQLVTMVYLGWAVGGPLMGLISDRLNSRRIPLLVGAIGALLSISVVIYMPTLPSVWIYALLFTYGLFCGAEVIVFALGKESVTPTHANTAVAVINMITMLSGVILQPTVGKLLDTFWSGEFHNHMRIYSMDEYQMALAVLPVALVLVVFFTLQVRASSAKKNTTAVE